MVKQIHVKSVSKYSLHHSRSKVIYVNSKRQKKSIDSYSTFRVSPRTEPIHSLGVQSSMISMARPVTDGANQSHQTLLTSVSSFDGMKQSSKKKLSNSKDQTVNKQKKFTNNQLIIIISTVALFIFTIITIAVYLIIRFTTKSTMTTTTAPILRWHLTAMTVAGIGGTAGTASNQLNAPADMALDSSNTLYISDCFNNRVQKWKTDSPNGTTAAGQASGTGASTANSFRGPKGILVDSNGNLYVSDSTNQRIQFWRNGASTGTTIAGIGTQGPAYDQLHTPHFITRDTNTNTLYISDYNNHRVMSYASDASNGTLVIGDQGSGINNTQLNSPVGVYFDSLTNNLFIVNYGGHHIVRWSLGAKSWTIVAGTAGMVGSSSTLLSYPTGLTLDPMGNLYVADTGNQRIQLFLAGQKNGTTIAGITGSTGSSSVQLSSPFSVRLDSQLNLYVADLSNNRIQKFLRY